YPASDVTTVASAPDLTISKITTNAPFTQGQTTASYSITVSNNGTGAVLAGNVVTARDFPPAGYTVTSLSGPGWSCVLVSLTCTRSDGLAVGGSFTAITVTGTVAGNAVGPLTNSASVSGGGELRTNNNTSSAQAQVTGAPDLQITKFHSGNFTP